MRARWGVLLLAACAASGLSSGACLDLFHSTSGLRTACELDATADGCGGFCATSSAEARIEAQHACAWLGACEGPIGGNAFGSCVFSGLLAFDCASNPNHPVRGEARSLWDCLRRAQSCAAVDACVWPGQKAVCGAASSAMCVESAASAVRTECDDGGTSAEGSAYLENCALWGQQCAGGGGGAAVCAGSAGEAGVACIESGCNGTALHWCDRKTGNDVGLDCAENGAQECKGFPSPGAAEWVACQASSDAGACTPDASAACTNGVAYSCPSGVLEEIDCSSLLVGSVGTANACAPGALSPAFDWTSPCVAATPACAGDSCSSDRVLVGCARGAPFSFDCIDAGLGPCRMVPTDLGAGTRAACTPP